MLEKLSEEYSEIIVISQTLHVGTTQTQIAQKTAERISLERSIQ